MEEVEQFVPPTREVGQIHIDLMSVTHVHKYKLYQEKKKGELQKHLLGEEHPRKPTFNHHS